MIFCNQQFNISLNNMTSSLANVMLIDINIINMYQIFPIIYDNEVICRIF